MNKKIKGLLRKKTILKRIYRETKISENDLVKTFGSKPYFQLVSECGDIPEAFGKEKSDLKQTLKQWGELGVSVFRQV